MSARRPKRAVDSFIAPLQRAVSVVTRAVLVREPPTPGRHPAVRFGVELVRLRGHHPLHLFVLVEYMVEQIDGASAPWTVRVTGYRFELEHATGQMLLAYHWHPAGVSPITFPHLHLGGTLTGINLSKAHLPTSLVTLQDVLRFAIVDLGVEPRRDDWPAVLAHPVPGDG